MRRVPGYLILLASLAVGALHAAEPKVYKWTDENGTVHFSTEAPAGAEEMRLDKGPTLAPADASAIPAAPALPAETAQRCAQHQNNIKMLEDAALTLSIEENGVKRPLNGEERAKQMQDARDALAKCEAAANTPAAPAPAPAPVPTLPKAG